VPPVITGGMVDTTTTKFNTRDERRHKHQPGAGPEPCGYQGNCNIQLIVSILWCNILTVVINDLYICIIWRWSEIKISLFDLFLSGKRKKFDHLKCVGVTLSGECCLKCDERR
jgi:hypothetical protein